MLDLLGNGEGYDRPDDANGRNVPSYAETYYEIEPGFQCTDSGVVPGYKRKIIISSGDIELIDACTGEITDLSASDVVVSEDGQTVLYDSSTFEYRATPP